VHRLAASRANVVSGVLLQQGVFKMTFDEFLAIVVMLNNYFHDLATAVFAVSALAAYLLQRTVAMASVPEILRPVVTGLVKIGSYALLWTLLGGVIRALAYRRYEWVEAAGRGQVVALGLKHVILVSLVVLGIFVLHKVRHFDYVVTSEKLSP